MEDKGVFKTQVRLVGVPKPSSVREVLFWEGYLSLDVDPECKLRRLPTTPRLRHPFCRNKELSSTGFLDPYSPPTYLGHPESTDTGSLPVITVF